MCRKDRKEIKKVEGAQFKDLIKKSTYLVIIYLKGQTYFLHYNPAFYIEFKKQLTY